MNRFNLRVYAIIINSENELLVSDECRYGKSFTKFPGGGLEWGEGQKETLVRELKEEMNVVAEIGDLFYVNDFFQQSAYRETDQLFSFYYTISKINFDSIPVSLHEVPVKEEGEKFRWVPLNRVDATLFTFPVDKVVAGKITELLLK